jgi:ribonuclease Y
LVGYIFRKTVGEREIGSAEQKARNLILDAENRSETIKKEITLEAKEEAHRMRSEGNIERRIRYG